jgi:hypothetical protein
MIIFDDIMSEIELEISRVRMTSEMSCFNFTNLISSMINHTTINHTTLYSAQKKRLDKSNPTVQNSLRYVA